MRGRKNKNDADQKAGKLGTSLYSEGPDRPRTDAPDDQVINKLASTVGTSFQIVPVSPMT